MNPVFWNRFYASLFQYVTEADLLELTPGLRVRVGFNKLLAPVAALIFKSCYARKVS